MIFLTIISIISIVSASEKNLKKLSFHYTLKNKSKVKIWTIRSKVDNYYFKSGMTIDADGAPNAYHPDDSGKGCKKENLLKGLDCLSHAGFPKGRWDYMLAVNKKGDYPAIQGKNDPYPGYFVSMTALFDKKIKNKRNPKRYVNSNTIPYFVLPPDFSKDIKKGDIALVYNKANNRGVFALFADVGPKKSLGEGSIALAKALKIKSSALTGGTDSGIHYLIFPGSGKNKPLTVKEIKSIGKKYFKLWGGSKKFKKLIRSFNFK